MRWALVAALALHLVLLLAFSTPWGRLRGHAPPEQVTAEMIFVDPGSRTAPSAPPAQPAPPAVSPSPPSEPAPQQATADKATTKQAGAEQATAQDPVPAPKVEEAALPTPPAAQPTEQAEPTRSTQPAQPAPPTPPPSGAPDVRLGEDDPGETGFIQSTDIPTGPDPTAPNIPPRYPTDAVRRRQEGTVVLEVAVAPDGQATRVGIYVSSGVAVLDRTAQEAIAHWRFRPKLDGGQPVAANTLISVHFRLD